MKKNTFLLMLITIAGLFNQTANTAERRERPPRATKPATVQVVTGKDLVIYTFTMQWNDNTTIGDIRNEIDGHIRIAPEGPTHVTIKLDLTKEPS